MSPSNPFDLTGKVALVTGASRGIGEAIAKSLAAQGARVIVSSRKLEGCEQVAGQIRQAGGQAEAMACHIGDLAAMQQTVAQIIERFGRIDILINNAAANPYFGPIDKTPVEAFDKTLEINIRGYFYMTNLVGQQMKKQGSGSIVNVASVNGVIPGEGQGIYSITKSAVIAMTRAHAKEWAARGIRVNCLLPGLTNTKFASAITDNPDIMKQVLPHIPMGRAAEPEEMTGQVLYFASDASRYTTGACVNVDGGYLLV
ncbi:SDR family oxidoreductase [Bowmanella dokdonensis]|uniref:SDR family oxidoreductase n=1 Tax=Bowmanella dokdonensis TaxID=751969 RepID=A0A939DLZ0_9ALTE|nr:SDR family oxidoreductase [Bowmanella dokdonensis]MBN7825035.1 SDR family oxidoreductase [Bowmanella dokdonensis]